MMSAFGVGAPCVDTVLHNSNTRPGFPLGGHVNLTGGSQAANIQHVTVALVTALESVYGSGEPHGAVEFHRLPVAGRLRLEPGQRQAIPFTLPMPWETPITDVFGQHLPGITMGLRTEVAIAHSVDKGDLDPVDVHPLPVQEHILAAFAQLGFRFMGTDLEQGRIQGVNQALPFYQEIGFYPGPHYAHGLGQVDLTFIANPHTVDIMLEFDKHSRMFGGDHDTYGCYTVPHEGTDQVDWVSQVDGWVRRALGHYHTMPGHAATDYPPGYAPGGYYGHHGDHGDHGGSGMGGMVAGAAVGTAGGFAGGVIVGEIIEEVFEDKDEEQPGSAQR
jgi:sporulation-control protein